MYIAFLNPQGNFDRNDSYWTEHPDFGGQLVYVKEVAIGLAALGNKVDILTRQIIDPEWPEFRSQFDGYANTEGVRIVRLPCGPAEFLPKEQLWPFLGPDWVPNILSFYAHEGRIPDVFTAHYGDGGLAGTLIHRREAVPFTFTAHSLGALKMDKLGADMHNIGELDGRFHLTPRIFAERLSMNYAARVITSTHQERMLQYGHRAYGGAIHPERDARFALIPPGVNRRIFNRSPGAADHMIAERIDHALVRDIETDRRGLPLVLASSRLDPKKNLSGLLSAFSSSSELRNTANLAIVVRGIDDPLREYGCLESTSLSVMENIITKMDEDGLWGRVTAFPLNNQYELAAAYRTLSRRKSVFALTAFYEPFGLAPLEAMSCGLPVVVTRNGGPAESLREGQVEFGVLVDPADEADIARGILRLLASQEVWHDFQRMGLERVDARYTWNRTASGYLRLFKDIRSEPPHAGKLEIPGYFTNPRDETDIPLGDLERLYFKGWAGS
jgi:sucrose-phosphate synthase